MIKKIISKIRQLAINIVNMNQKFDEIKINQGIILSNLNKNKTAKNLREYEFKIFSQNGEDGIIQYLIDSIDIKNKTFIDENITIKGISIALKELI